MNLAIVALGSYLVGSIPFGYLVGRARGVNLFEAGSGNIGATNVGRVLGRYYGVLVFVLDLLKGALPVAAVGAFVEGDQVELATVIAAASAFLGHLFPIFLGFRGGKGIATGAGTVLVLVPIPALAAIGTWLLVVLATRIVSLASIAAILALVVLRLILTNFQFNETTLPATAYCLIGSLFVIAKHRGNLQRIFQGNENKIGDGPMRQSLLRILHVLAVGLWFGGAAFFNFGVAPSLFDTYKVVVSTAPSDRTAHQPIGVSPPTAESQKALASALFGAGVGPIFPIYFGMMTICGMIAVWTSVIFWHEQPGVRLHFRRYLLASGAWVIVLIGWAVSYYVSELRVEQFDSSELVAAQAKEAFKSWHFVSLFMSFVIVLLAGALLALTVWLPQMKSSVESKINR